MSCNENICILLVESSQLVEEVINNLLTSFVFVRFNVTVAHTVKQALTILGDLKVTVLPTDNIQVVLLDPDGLDVPKEIAMQQVIASAETIPVIILGSCDCKLRHEAERLGTVEYLVKGHFGAFDLVKAIRRAHTKNHVNNEFQDVWHGLEEAGDTLSKIERAWGKVLPRR